MCELLLMRVSRSGANKAETDLLFQEGDIVRIEDDGYPWSKEEDPTTATPIPHLGNSVPFYILGVQGITAAEMDATLYTNGDQFNPDFDTHKRVWHVDIPTMSILFSASLTKLQNNQAVSLKNFAQGGNNIGDVTIRTSTGLTFKADPPPP